MDILSQPSHKSSAGSASPPKPPSEKSVSASNPRSPAKKQISVPKAARSKPPVKKSVQVPNPKPPVRKPVPRPNPAAKKSITTHSDKLETRFESVITQVKVVKPNPPEPPTLPRKATSVTLPDRTQAVDGNCHQRKGWGFRLFYCHQSSCCLYLPLEGSLHETDEQKWYAGQCFFGFHETKKVLPSLADFNTKFTRFLSFYRAAGEKMHFSNQKRNSLQFPSHFGKFVWFSFR